MPEEKDSTHCMKCLKKIEGPKPRVCHSCKMIEPFRTRCNRCGKVQDFVPPGADPKKWFHECGGCGHSFRPWRPRRTEWGRWE